MEESTPAPYQLKSLFGRSSRKQCVAPKSIIKRLERGMSALTARMLKLRRGNTELRRENTASMSALTASMLKLRRENTELRRENTASMSTLTASMHRENTELRREHTASMSQLETRIRHLSHPLESLVVGGLCDEILNHCYYEERGSWASVLPPGYTPANTTWGALGIDKKSFKALKDATPRNVSDAFVIIRFVKVLHRHTQADDDSD